jgi:hypothetical protein
MLRLAPLLLLCSCDTTIDWVVKGEADHGTVFVCADGCTKPDGTPGYEYCWDGDADELGALLGTTCRDISFSDRIWPALVGCAYSCDGSLEGPGANAHCGTACR